MNKTCVKCKVSKPFSEFHKDKSRKGVLFPYCKACASESRRIYYENNKEKVRESHRIYYESNKEQVRESQRVYRENNKEKVNEHDRFYKKNNPEKRRLWGRKRRAMKRKVEENYTLEMESFVHTFFDGKCYNCSSTENITHDHHLPLSKGYALEPGNAVLLCRSCNASKGRKLPKNFYTREQLTEITTLLTHQAQLWSMGARIGK